MPEGNNEAPWYKKNIRLVLLTGIGVTVAAALMIQDYKAQVELERVSVPGIVLEEAIIGGYYSFSMQTEYGKKAFLVAGHSGREPEVSSIAALVQPGARFIVDGIVKNDLDKLELMITTSQIKPE